MKIFLRISLLLLAVGCVRAEVRQLDQVARPARSPDSVMVFQEKPQQQYTVIATINTRGETLFDSFDDLRRRLVVEAAQIGGDAVILVPESTESNLIFLPTGFLIISETRQLAAEIIVFNRRSRRQEVLLHGS